MIRVSSRIGLIIGTIPAAPRDILLGSRCKNSFFVFCWAKDDQLELEPEDGRSVKATTAKTANATNGAQIRGSMSTRSIENSTASKAAQILWYGAICVKLCCFKTCSFTMLARLLPLGQQCLASRVSCGALISLSH